MQYHDDVLHTTPILTAARSSAGTSISVNSGPSGDTTLPCTILIFRTGTVGPITGLTATAFSGQTITVSGAAAGFIDANLNAGDVVQFPEAVVLADTGKRGGPQPPDELHAAECAYLCEHHGDRLEIPTGTRSR